MGWREPCCELLLAPGPGSPFRPWVLATWHLPDLHGLPRGPLCGNGGGDPFQKRIIVVDCRLPESRNGWTGRVVLGWGAESRCAPPTPGPSDSPSDMPSWPHAILGIKASSALHDHKKGSCQRPSFPACTARSGARLAVSCCGLLSACVHASLGGGAARPGAEKLLLPPIPPAGIRNLPLHWKVARLTPRPFQPTPMGEASQDVGTGGSCSTSLVRRSKKPNLSFWRLRNTTLPGASGRTEPPVGLACAPGSGAHPFPTVPVGTPFFGQQMTALSVISSLAHSHPAQQGTHAGPWQQTWGLSLGQELLAEAVPAAP